jgi:hypothetical protein
MLSSRFLDLVQTCEDSGGGEFINCQCNHAQRLLDNGQIDCSIHQCPSECDVCTFCLDDVLETACHSAQSSTPPTFAPTISPFDMADCASFSNDWFLDLASTCVGDDLDACQCIDAERRLSHGQIQCGVDMCPTNCPICEFCMDTLSCN